MNFILPLQKKNYNVSNRCRTFCLKYPSNRIKLEVNVVIYKIGILCFET